jgi:hypothetical protein
MNAPACHGARSESRDVARRVPPEVAAAPRARWATRLRRHLTIAFIAKLVLLALLYVLCFPPSQRPHLDANDVADRILPPG